MNFEWKSWFNNSYFYDYVVLAMIVLSVGIMSITISPHCRYQDVNSPLVNFPIETDIFPNWTLSFMAGLIPVTVFIVSQFVFFKHLSLHDLHSIILTLIQGCCICFLITQFGKFYAGRPRPNWVAQVKGKGLDLDNLKTICDFVDLNDARMSFPSGHSSFSFMGMTITSLYLAGKLHLFSEGRGNMLKMLVFLCPLLLAGMVATSRTRDFHHNYSDILAGSLIGICCAIMSYFMNYPQLGSTNSDLPFNRKESSNLHHENLERGYILEEDRARRRERSRDRNRDFTRVRREQRSRESSLDDSSSSIGSLNDDSALLR